MLSTNSSGVHNAPHLLQEKLERHLAFYQQDENNLNLLLEISELYSDLDDLDQPSAR